MAARQTNLSCGWMGNILTIEKMIFALPEEVHFYLQKKQQRILMFFGK